MSAVRNRAPASPEERIARAIAAIRADLDPDPLFERRLRSQVLNRYVAAREGAVAPGAQAAVAGGKEMGRLGRAVLYASFVLSVSVTSVMAASQDAVPGDLFYPLKRDIEAMRHRVLPEEFEALLLRTEFTARLDELAAIAQQGDAALIAGLADEVSETYDAAARLAPESSDSLVVLNALLDTLPEEARVAVGDVVTKLERDASRPSTSQPPQSSGSRSDTAATGRGQGAAGATGVDAGPAANGASGSQPAGSAPARPSHSGDPSPGSPPRGGGRGN